MRFTHSLQQMFSQLTRLHAVIEKLRSNPHHLRRGIGISEPPGIRQESRIDASRDLLIPLDAESTPADRKESQPWPLRPHGSGAHRRNNHS